MNTCYDNIVIPVDQFLNTEKAIVRAMELAKPWRTTIHLVHLVRSWNLIRSDKSASAYGGMLDNDLDGYVKALLNLMHWKSIIECNGRGIAGKIHIRQGISLQSLVLLTTQKEQASLIIMACRQKRKWFSFGKNISARLLAQKSGCRILSIKTDVQAGFTGEVETLFKPIFKRRNQFSYAGLFLKPLYGLLSHK